MNQVNSVSNASLKQLKYRILVPIDLGTRIGNERGVSSFFPITYLERNTLVSKRRANMERLMTPLKAGTKDYLSKVS